ncbi:MAG: 23S rRNA (uracil(1939)-C(5))-methyltransferase RlmD [Deltaproteobacteria bacterium]|nr:23S rRNA (uracil(1939)-C(5))-methyltransferase RlmD [Deltaproteobacteria bacterium]
MTAPSAAATPRCRHFPQCVGCTLIGTAYTAQLAAKRERLAAALAAHARLAGVTAPAVEGSPRMFGYRNQAKLVARRARRGLLLGVYRPGTHQVVDIAQCEVHHPLITRVLANVQAALEAAAAPIYDERDASGWLRYVVLRVSEWKHAVQVILVVRDRSWRGERPLLERIRRIRGVAGVVLNLNASSGNVIFGAQFLGPPRELSLLDRLAGFKLSSRAGAFLQANLGTARRVYAAATRYAALGPEASAVDLYCGVGALTFHLATQAQFVVGVEAVPGAVLDAKQNIRLNGFHNVRFLAAPAAAGMAQAAELLQHVDVVTLNPPRTGADEAARSAIHAAKPRRIVYVSCEPKTLARDLDWFAARGWRVGELAAFDMLPQTEHVETVALLTRA